MACYMQLVVLTDKGRRNFEDDPEWINEVNKHIELLGARILTQYALLGQYDFVNIIEAPNDDEFATLAISIAKGGNIRTATLKAFDERLAAATCVIDACGHMCSSDDRS